MVSPLKFATWNVNGIRARHDRMLAFLEAHQPDLVGLQELKCVEEHFPLQAVEELGYQAAIHGQKSWNGVAILSRAPASDVDVGLDEQSRAIAATVHGVRWINLYVPNGSKVGADKYHYKLRWLDALEDFLTEQQASHGDFVVMGDFNIILHDYDACRPDAWESVVICDPVTRRRLEAIMERFGLTDIIRRFHPGPGIYTWWDYVTSGFEWNNGVRIDHILATPSVTERIVNAWVNVDERGEEKPSDHVPVLARMLTNGLPASSPLG